MNTFVSEPPVYGPYQCRYLFWLQSTPSVYSFVCNLPEVEDTFRDGNVLWVVLMPIVARDQLTATVVYRMIKEQIDEFLECDLDPDVWQYAIEDAFAVVGDYVGTIDNRDDDADSWEPPF